jgi:hypothetical protein
VHLKKEEVVTRSQPVVIALVLASALSAGAESFSDGLGIRGGIGTDITFGGVAGGAGINKLFDRELEIGLVFYYGSFEETDEEAVNTYVDTTKVTAFAALLNYLYGYHRDEGGFFFLAGVGLAYLGVSWEERSDTDPTLGTLLPGGGSKQTFDGSVGGLLTNLGVGYAFAGGVDVRLEVPIVIAFGDTGGASSVIPLFTLTGGYRFAP